MAMQLRPTWTRAGVGAVMCLAVVACEVSVVSSEGGGEESESDGRTEDAGASAGEGGGESSPSESASDAGSASDSAADASGEDEASDEGSGSSDAGDGETGELPPSDGWFELGQGEDNFSPLTDGGPIDLVLGGQGLWMFPMPVRGGGFALPDNPLDFDDPNSPRLSVTFDVDDFTTVSGDHFAKIGNLPVPFDDLGDGTCEYIYLPVIAPNEFTDGCSIDGHTAHVSATLAVGGGGAPLTFDLDLVVVVPPNGGPACD